MSEQIMTAEDVTGTVIYGVLRDAYERLIREPATGREVGVLREAAGRLAHADAPVTAGATVTAEQRESAIRALASRPAFTYGVARPILAAVMDDILAALGLAVVDGPSGEADRG